MKVRHLVYILGNHDAWALQWAREGGMPGEWLSQGGSATISSYAGVGMPAAHCALLSEALLYFEDSRRLFVHGGFDVERGVKGTRREMFFWDRTLLDAAAQRHHTCPEWKFGDHAEIFVGHTPTLVYGKNTPLKFCNVWIPAPVIGAAA